MERSKIVFLYNEKAIFYDGKDIKSANFKDTKKFFTGALVPLKYVDTLTFKLPKKLSNDELSIQVEIKMYEEAGLDANKEYVIDFLKYDMGDEYIIEAFALNKDDFETEFNRYNKKIEAIDLVFPRFLSYQALYNKGLNPDKNDLFICLDEDEAFAVIYKRGEYIGYRLIDSISSISKRVGIETAKLKEYLSLKGLQRKNYSLDETHIIDALQEIFLKNIEKIVYSINHKRTIFALEGIDRIFVDFDGKSIDGLKEFFVSFGYENFEIESVKCCDKEGEETKIFLFCEYIYQAANETKNLQKLNLSFWERKRPIYEYTIFKYTAVLALFTLLGLSIYGYFYYNNLMLEESIVKKEKRLKSLKRESAKYLKELKRLKDKNQKIKKEIENIEHKMFVYETTLKMIPFIERQKVAREEFMNDVVYALAKYRLNTEYIKQKNPKEMEIMLISEYYQRDRIAKFIKELLNRGYSEVKTAQISYTDGVYTSSVKVKR